MNLVKNAKIILFLIPFVIISCNRKGERFKPENFEGEVIVSDTLLSSHFKFSIDVKSEDANAYFLYYRDRSDRWFNDDYMIVYQTEGGNTFENLTFELPHEGIPLSLRWDVGTNKFEGESAFEIGQFTFTYRHKEIKIDAAHFDEYFLRNGNIDIDKKKLIYRLVEREGEKYDPYFLSTEKLNPILYYLGLK